MVNSATSTYTTAAMCSTTTITKLLKHSHPHLFLIQNCTNIKQLMKFHAQFITNGLSDHTLFLSNILSFTALSPSGDLSYAQSLFNHIHSPNVFMYNTMIRGYANSLKALSLYIQMLRSKVIPNNYTYPFLIKAIYNIGDEKFGQMIHSSVMKNGHVSDLHVVNSLLHMYGSFGLSYEVSNLFEEMPEPDVVSWNVMIDDLAKNGSFDDVLATFKEMCYYRIEPSSITFLGLVSSCAKTGDFRVGKSIHSCIIKKGINFSENLGNGLLDMYAKFEDMESAEKLFNRMIIKTVFSWTSMVDGYIQKGDINQAFSFFNQIPNKDITAWNVMLNGFIEVNDIPSAEKIFNIIPDKDIVSWNSMIVGYAQQNQYKNCLKLFKKMLYLEINPDRITLDSLFSVSTFHLGESIHSYMVKRNINGEEVESALINMYCKNGAIKNGKTVFKEITKKSVLAWSVMINGLAINGYAKEAIELFNRMINDGIKPNEFTFIAVLLACSYGGLVKEGRWYFNAMKKLYEVEPKSEHYCCMVDILGRAGLVKEAEIFIRDLPDEVNSEVWGVLLGACSIHGEVRVGEKVASILTEMEPSKYVILSNIYAEKERWVEAYRVRMKMKALGVRKTIGLSLLS